VQEAAPDKQLDLPQEGSPYRALRGVGIFLLVAALGIAVVHFLPGGSFLTAEGITKLADGLGAWGPAVIVMAGVTTPLLFLPRWPIAFLAGLLYGVAAGTFLATAASTLGAWLHFSLCKKLLAPAADRLRRRYKIEKYNIPRDKEFLAIFFLRAFPLSSFVATNLLAGALKMEPRRFVIASFLGMIPSSVMYAAWGKLLKKPSGEFYAVALASLVFIVLGTLLAQKAVHSWMSKKQRPADALLPPRQA